MAAGHPLDVPPGRGANGLQLLTTLADDDTLVRVALDEDHGVNGQRAILVVAQAFGLHGKPVWQLLAQTQGQLLAHEVQLLLAGGNPAEARAAEVWRPIVLAA